MPAPFPAILFLAITTPARSRVFLLTRAATGDSQLELVTTTTVPEPDAVDLVRALNDAARTGDRTDVDRCLALQPAPVGEACRQALDRSPAVPDETPGVGGMQTLRDVWFSSVEEATEHMRAAMTVGLQLVLTNERRHGAVELHGSLLSDDIELPFMHTPYWTPVLENARLLSRSYPSEQELPAALSDELWQTHHSRAYWVWTQDREDDNAQTVEVVVEHWDRPITTVDDELAFRVDDDSNDDDRGPLTPRNRLVLYMALIMIVTDLDTLIGDWERHESMVRDDMPDLVHAQPREWWVQMFRAAERLLEAARTGKINDLEPRTIAEEALLAVAVTDGYTDSAHDTAEMLDLNDVFDDLPRDEEWDGEYHEILGHLTGDEDVLMLWDDEMAGVEDPNHPTNRHLGMGDYRPERWHDLFARSAGS